MLSTQKNKLTMSILNRLRQGGPPPPGNMQPFSPLGEPEALPGNTQQPGPSEAEELEGEAETQGTLDLLQQSGRSRKKLAPKKPGY